MSNNFSPSPGGFGGIFGSAGRAAAQNAKGTTTASQMHELLAGLGVAPMSEEEENYVAELGAPEVREATPEELARMGSFEAPAPKVLPQKEPVKVEAPIYIAPPPAPVSAPAEPSKEEEKQAPSLYTFTDMEKLAMADALVGMTPEYSYQVKFNKILRVDFRVMSDAQTSLVNRAVQQADLKGVLRRTKSRMEGYDQAGKPVLQEVDADVPDNVDKMRQVRLAELAVSIVAINGRLLPEKYEDAVAVLEKMPSMTLDIIWKKGFLKLLSLQRAVEESFETF